MSRQDLKENEMHKEAEKITANLQCAALHLEDAGLPLGAQHCKEAADALEQALADRDEARRERNALLALVTDEQMGEYWRSLATWKLTPAQSDQFADALINPPEPNAALREAAKRHHS